MAKIVHAAGDVYNSDLMMGLAEFDLSGHWKDELVKLEGRPGRSGAASGREYRLEPRRVTGRYYLGAGAAPAGYQRVDRGPSADVRDQWQQPVRAARSRRPLRGQAGNATIRRRAMAPCGSR